jgi:hypothetical protein
MALQLFNPYQLGPIGRGTETSAATALPEFDVLYDFGGWYHGGQQAYREYGTRYSTLTSVPNTTFTRATTAVTEDLSGALRAVASGDPAIGQYKGMGFWPQLQNKCTNYSANPTDLTNVTLGGDPAATLTVVDDTAALAAAGLSGICTSGKVYKLDNSAGATTATATISGNPGNTNAHRTNAYIRGGTGTIGGQTSVLRGAFAAASDYTRRAYTWTPDTATRPAGISADAGQTIYFILNMLVEASYSGPVIPVAGTAATRNADVHTKTGLALNPAGFAVLDWGRWESTMGGNAIEMSDGTGANRIHILTGGVDVRARIVTGGVATAIAGPAIVTGALFKSLLRYDGGTSWAYFCNGTKYTAFSALPSMNRLDLGASSSGSAQRLGQSLLFALRNRPGLTDAECIALTTL